MVQLKQFTLHRRPTIQTKMSLATAEIDCTISAPLSGATELLFHRPGPAAANALSAKVLYVCVTPHVWLAVERCRRLQA